MNNEKRGFAEYRALKEKTGPGLSCYVYKKRGRVSIMTNAKTFESYQKLIDLADMLADCAEELIADARDLLDKKIISEVLPIEKNKN